MTSKNSLSHVWASGLKVIWASGLKVIVALTALIALAACGTSKTGSPDAGGSAAVAPPTITMAVTLAAPGEGGRRDASVRIETSAPLVDVQLDFGIPESCQRVAGAATRMVPSILPTQPVSQGIGFQCPAETQGSVTVKLTGKDAQGRAVDTSAEAKL